MIPIFIGYDSAESVAYHVLAHTIIKHASHPVAITPIGNEVLPGYMWNRPRGPHDSTEFSNARFLVPRLMDYKGWALFMDCDMVCQDDIMDLWTQAAGNQGKAVLVRQHTHVPSETTKFLGAEQTRYERKNWSSLMLMNCAHPAWKRVNPNAENGLVMHRFEFLEDSEIGAIEGTWNELVLPEKEQDLKDPSLAHLTLGGPWHGWVKSLAAYRWGEELSDMLAGNNPRAHISTTLTNHGLVVGGSYHASEADIKAEADAFKK